MTKILQGNSCEDIRQGMPVQSAKKIESGTKAILAATFGNLLEIYDFIVFGMFAIPISKTFFPNSSESNALLFTFLIFGAGFLARPLGAFALGSYSDRHGRKRALTLTLFLMAIGTVFIAVCPGYNSIGIMAPILIVIGRLTQGFSAGGEIGSAVAMLVESAPKEKRGYYAAFQQLSQGAGVLLAGLVGFALSVIFTDAQLHDWGWRVAFAIGLLIVPVGLMIRKNVDETRVFEKRKADVKHTPLLALLRDHKFAVATAIGIMVFWTISSYVSNYLTTYAMRELHLNSSASFAGLIAYGLTMLIVSPLSGRLSDRIGKKIPMLTGSLGTLIFSYPLFYLLTTSPSIFTLVIVQMCFGVFLALYASCATAVLGEIFPTSVRATGIGVSYAFGVMIFGGFTPAIITSLIAYVGDKLAISYYLAAAALLSGIIVMFRNDQRDINY